MGIVPLLFFIWHVSFRVYCAAQAAASLDFRAKTAGPEQYRRLSRCLKCNYFSKLDVQAFLTECPSGFA
jgi:hypothetical protein